MSKVEHVTVTSTMFVGKVKHDELHPDDGGTWHVGSIDWWQALLPFDGRRVRVTIQDITEEEQPSDAQE